MYSNMYTSTYVAILHTHQYIFTHIHTHLLTHKHTHIFCTHTYTHTFCTRWTTYLYKLTYNAVHCSLPQHTSCRISSSGSRQNHGHLSLCPTTYCTSAAWHWHRLPWSLSRERRRPATKYTQWRLETIYISSCQYGVQMSPQLKTWRCGWDLLVTPQAG